MSGGSQLKLSQFLVGTPVGDAIVAAYRRGVGHRRHQRRRLGHEPVHDLARRRGPDPPAARPASSPPGSGLLEDVIVDQHFDQRGRYGRLMSLVANSPNLLGIGIDENTAVEIRDDRVMTIVGTGGVFVIDARNAVTDAPDARRGAPLLVSGAVVHSLPTGATFDLRSVTLTRFVERHPDIEVAVAQREGPRRTHPRPGAARGDLSRRIPDAQPLSPSRVPSRVAQPRRTPVGRRAPHPDRPPLARPDHRRVAGLPRPELLVVREGHPPRRRPRRPRGLPERHHPRASPTGSSSCCPG